MSFDNKDDIRRLKREIVLLKRKIQHLKFKNSSLFKILSVVNIFIFIIFCQFVISYIFSVNYINIKNANIEFKVYPYRAQDIKLYTIIFKYENYHFRARVNKSLESNIIYSDAIVSTDLFFKIPLKLKFKNLNNRWFFVNESLGILTICSIILFVQSIAYIYKQNEYYYPLFSISLLSIISFIGIVIFSLHIHKFI